MSREPFHNVLRLSPEPERPDLPVPTPEASRAEFERARFKLIQAARLAWEQGVSYRGFKVGCAVLAWHPKEGWIIYTGHNFKPEPRPERGEDKRCAERNALNAAENDGCIKIAAIVTISDQRSTGDDGDTPHGVLHSCPDCLNLFRELPSIDKTTVLYNVHDGDLKIDPAGAEIVDRRALPGVSPITRRRHQKPALDTDFTVMGEERTMEELLGN